jgi:hypothetical protein
MPNFDREDLILQQFCDSFSEWDKVPVKVVRNPDRENPGHGGCDAIILLGNEEWACEIAELESFPRMREYQDRAKRIGDDLRAMLSNDNTEYYITIVIDFGKIPKVSV